MTRASRQSARRATLALIGCGLFALALLAQSLAFASSPMDRAAQGAAAAEQLHALFGGPVLVCVHDDDQIPSSVDPCQDHCPLCQAAATPAAWIAPPPLALEAKLVIPRVVERKQSQPPVRPLRYTQRAPSRAPPIET